MRIRGAGSGFSGFGGDRGRSDAFKKGRHPGQKVQGVLLRKERDDMAWVDIEGHRLLAQINTTAPEGSKLTFLIKQLTPNIILKVIFAPSSSGSSTLNLARNFDIARNLFENAFHSYSDRLRKVDADKRKIAFISLLQDDRALLSKFTGTTKALALINASLPKDAASLRFMPWMIPMARRQLTRIHPKSTLLETVTEFDLPVLGTIRSIFLTKDDTVSYRLLIQHKGPTLELQRYLENRDHSSHGGNIQLLEVSQLPRRNHGGLLAEIMFKG